MGKSNNWKKVEYKVARLLGGVRVPVSGRAGAMKGDVLHDKYFIEVKTGKQIPKHIVEWYEELKKYKYDKLLVFEFSIPKTVMRWYNKALKECPKGKRVLLVMKPRYCHDELVLWKPPYTTYFYFTTLKTFAKMIRGEDEYVGGY